MQERETQNTNAACHTWTAWPARDRPGRAVSASLLIAAVSGATGMFARAFGAPMSEMMFWCVIAGAALVISLNRFYFPSHFSVDDNGLTARYAMRQQGVSWKNVRRFVHDARGGYLSTRARRSRFDAFRGVHILLGDSREEVVRFIETHLAKAHARRDSHVNVRAPDVTRDHAPHGSDTGIDSIEAAAVAKTGEAG